MLKTFLRMDSTIIGNITMPGIKEFLRISKYLSRLVIPNTYHYL
jgi:hypothetical protein